MEKFDSNYWGQRWEKDETPWDIGYAAPAITEYTDALSDKDIKILIPGCGNAYEGEYLIKKGFKNTFLLDLAPQALQQVRNRFPAISEENLLLGDFFNIKGEYDLIIEQTFFCALDPSMRKAYTDQMYALLKPGGILMGLLFDAPLNNDHPPFGGNKDEYLPLFQKLFNIRHLESCYNSIKPRAGRELFLELVKN